MKAGGETGHNIAPDPGMQMRESETKKSGRKADQRSESIKREQQTRVSTAFGI